MLYIKNDLIIKNDNVNITNLEELINNINFENIKNTVLPYFIKIYGEEYESVIKSIPREKALVCKEESIDIFIDNQLNNCLDIAQIGIKAIRISDDLEEHNNIINLSNWNKIYEYIARA